MARDHLHRRPRKKDFEGKTIAKFSRLGDNIWSFHFTDGSTFAIQSETFSYGSYGSVASMVLCEECAEPVPPPKSKAPKTPGRIKGGIARAMALTPERRKEIGRLGAAARWGSAGEK